MQSLTALSPSNTCPRREYVRRRIRRHEIAESVVDLLPLSQAIGEMDDGLRRGDPSGLVCCTLFSIGVASARAARAKRQHSAQSGGVLQVEQEIIRLRFRRSPN
jgi:hypothetical protein